MNTNMIDAETLAKMFLAGAKNLEANKEWINELNVFPVPDGDTGTNMTLTIMSAANEVCQLEHPTTKELAKAISSGSLRGARGNSGVILSQLLRGFTKGIADYKNMDAITIANAMEKGIDTAYKAVMKPKEGTILTVARAASDKAVEICEETEDLQEFFEQILACAKDTLSRTPDMLPVLKEAGVVDSGGQGLIQVYEGALDAFLGKEIDYTFTPGKGQGQTVRISAQTEAEIRFGYCTEFIILLEKPVTIDEEKGFKAYLESIGDSIVVVADDELIKVHVHTNDPGQAISKALTYGALSRIKIDNMREEHEEKLIKDAEKIAAQQKAEEEKNQQRKPVGFIAVSVGEGIGKIFTELGVDYLIEGGQTMNPSTEDMLNAIDRVNADTIFIFPNNKNIILAANQAAELCTDKQVVVIPTKTVPQGITAVINYVPENTVESNEKTMNEEISLIHSGEVTYAVRDTHLDGKDIHQGDIMGIGDFGILAVGKDVEEVTCGMIDEMLDEDSELISIYYGEDLSHDDAARIGEKVEEAHPDCDVEVNYGGQPIYYCLVSVE